MSSSTPQGTGTPTEGRERKGLGKVLSRAKTFLKRGESSMRSQSSTEAPAKPTPASEPAKKTEPAPQSKAAAARARYEAMQGVSKYSKAQMLEERARNLSERFGLDIKASEWHAASTVDDTVLRTDKPIRMRVRRSCHQCNTNFTTSNECGNCKHTRCSQCTRYPPKRTEQELIASRERRAAIIKANKENAPIIADYGWDEKEILLKRPSKTGGQDLVYKKPRQRVRRTCHGCATVFKAGSKKCEQCGHSRCTDCPRDPPKKDKYPLGYPGDEFGPNSIPHYECEKCKCLYPTNAEHGTQCRKCQHPKSEASPRAQPRKVEPEPDPEVISRLQARLEGLKVA